MHSQSNVLFTQTELKKMVIALADEISKDYADKKLLIISILNGAFIFTADLVRYIDIDCSIEFVVASSYGNELKSSMNVDIKMMFEQDLSEYDVLVVDELLETGRTLLEVCNRIRLNSPKSLRTCVLLKKIIPKEKVYSADYIGTEISDKFIFGYGMNLGSQCRSLPYVGFI